MLQSLYLNILSTFNIILFGFAANGSTYCKHVHCENNNPCETVFTHTGGSHVSAQCVCHGMWAGTRCESQIHVNTGDVTSHSVQIEIHVINANETGSHNQDPFSHTLMYWKNSTDHACALIQELTTRSHRVDGLEPNTGYTICIESGVLETCLITYHNDTTLSSNCVFVSTHEFSSQTVSNYIAGVVTCALSVVVILAIIVAAILIRRRHYILFDNLFGACQLSSSTCCRRKRPSMPQAATDMIVSPDSPLMPSSCKMDFLSTSSGKDKHKLLKHRNRGYASYSAKNGLTTVLEYNPECETLESDPLTFTDLADSH